jgi:L-lactate dehydrogenase
MSSPIIDNVNSRIAIIGAGSVGSTCAYALLLRRVSSDILLFDTDTIRLQAQVQDLSDAAFLSNTRVRSSTAAEAGQCNIIVITAGAKQRDGESRRDLVDRNYTILQSVLRKMSPIRKDAVLLLVSNPVDVLTYLAQKLSGLPHAQVIGSGTFLDSVRLRSALAEQVQVTDTAIHAYVLGEHGDSQMVAWSTATVAGSPIQTFLPPSSPSLSDLADTAKTKAYSIIAAKGATSYGIASIVSSICESILFNQRHVRPVSHWVESFGTYVSLPAVLGHGGIQKTIHVPLNENEREMLTKSIDEIKEIVRMVEEKAR